MRTPGARLARKLVVAQQEGETIGLGLLGVAELVQLLSRLRLAQANPLIPAANGQDLAVGCEDQPGNSRGRFQLPDLFARVRLAEMDSLVGAESQVFPVLAEGDRRHGGAFRGLDLAGFLARGQVPEFHGALGRLRVSFGGRGRQRLAVWSESEPRRFQAAPA